ncbi:MAG: hypothetical protein AB7J40_06270 [Candidatus Altimarinota bacterium]
MSLDQHTKTPNPEYAPDHNGRLILEVRHRLSREAGFKEDLRNFLGVPGEQYQAFPNPQIDLINIVIKRIGDDRSFQERLMQFLAFCKAAENLIKESQTTRGEVKKTLTSPSEKAPSRMNSPQVPDLQREKEFTAWFIDQGYRLSGAHFYQICRQIRKEQAKPKKGLLSFFRTEKPPAPKTKTVSPRQVMGVLKNSLRNMKTSPLTFQQLRKKAEQAKVQCEPISTRTDEEESFEPAFVLTSDGYCLELILDQKPMKMFYDPERL